MATMLNCYVNVDRRRAGLYEIECTRFMQKKAQLGFKSAVISLVSQSKSPSNSTARSQGLVYITVTSRVEPIFETFQAIPRDPPRPENAKGLYQNPRRRCSVPPSS